MMRVKHPRPFKFMNCPWRRFCKPWWGFWFNPKEYWEAVVTYWDRARYGYAATDLYSLDWYLLTWMEFALRDFQKQDTITQTWNSEKGKRELAIMQDGWRAGYEMIDMSGRWKDKKSTNLNNHWETGLKIWCKRFFQLWW